MAVNLPTVANENTVSVLNSKEATETCVKYDKTQGVSASSEKTSDHKGCEDIGPKMKRCYKCGRVLPLTEFSKDNSKSDGHRGICRECVHAYNEELRKKKAMAFSQLKQENEAISNMAADTGVGVVDKEAEKKSMPFGFPKKINRMMRIANGPETKVCAKCGKEKSIVEFSCDKGSCDGFSSKCKQCTSEIRKEYRHKKSEEQRVKKLNDETTMSRQKQTIIEQYKTIEDLRAQVYTLQSEAKNKTREIYHFPVGAEVFCFRGNEISKLEVDDVDITVSMKKHSSSITYYFKGGRIERVPGEAKLYATMNEVTMELARISGYQFK